MSGTQVLCPLCGGAGRFDDVECQTCATTGYVAASIYPDDTVSEVEPAAARRAPSTLLPTTCRGASVGGATAPLDEADGVARWVVFACVFVAGWAAAPSLNALLERIA